MAGEDGDGGFPITSVTAPIPGAFVGSTSIVTVDKATVTVTVGATPSQASDGEIAFMPSVEASGMMGDVGEGLMWVVEVRKMVCMDVDARVSVLIVVGPESDGVEAGVGDTSSVMTAMVEDTSEVALEAASTTLEVALKPGVGATAPETVEMSADGGAPCALFMRYEILSQASPDTHFWYKLIQAAPPQFSLELPAHGMLHAPIKPATGALPLVIEFPQ